MTDMEVCFKNFRAFEDTGFLKIKKITLLVGENSSGKTSFLAGLNHLYGLLEGDSQIDLNSPPFELGSFKDVFRSSSKHNEKKYFKYECKIGSNLCRYEFEDDDGNSALLTIFIENAEAQMKVTVQPKKFQSLLEISLSEEEVELLRKEKMPKHFEIDCESKKLTISRRFSSLFGVLSRMDWMDMLAHEVRFSRYEEHERIIGILAKKARMSAFRNLARRKSTTALAPMRTQPARVYSYGQSGARITPDGSHIPSKLLKQHKEEVKERDLEEMLNAFGKEAGLFQDISIKRLDRHSDYPFSIIVKTNQGRKSNIMDVGYGVSQILPVIFDIIYSSPERRLVRHERRFLLQQPEVHLHPRAQAAFGSLLAKLAAEEKGKKFVVETHSDFILDRLKYEITQGTISEDDVGILFFDTEQKKTKIWQIDLDKEGLPAESPPKSYRRFFLDEGDKVWS